MNNFRIVKERKYKHKKDTLYVLMFKDGNTFGIDVANSAVGFGRVVVDSKSEAEYLLERFSDLIVDTNNYVRSCELCSSALKGKDFKNVVLFLHTEGRHISKMEAYALIYMLGFDKTDIYSLVGFHTIELREPGNDEIYGQFSLRDDDKYLFNFF